MDEATWLALTAVLTALGAAWTAYAWRHRGLASGLRGAALTLLAPAAYLTGTLELGVEIAGSAADWATSLVFSPLVWLGVALAGVAAMLYVVSGFLRSRTIGASARPASPAVERPPDRPALPGRASTDPGIDPELADIEEILRRRGIT